MTARDRYEAAVLRRMHTKPKTADEIIAALKGKYINPYNGHKWALFTELRLGTGWGNGADQRIDLWVMGMWASNQLARIAYEVKVSRSDFLHEIKRPLKRRQALLVSNQFWFAAPFGMIDASEIPVECGLVEFGYAGDAAAPRLEQVVAVPAPWRDTPPPNWVFVAALCRRIEDGSVVRKSADA